jgi:hypothetical protein
MSDSDVISISPFKAKILRYSGIALALVGLAMIAVTLSHRLVFLPTIHATFAAVAFGGVLAYVAGRKAADYHESGDERDLYELYLVRTAFLSLGCLMMFGIAAVNIASTDLADQGPVSLFYDAGFPLFAGAALLYGVVVTWPGKA